MLHQATERGPYADRLELLKLAKTHPWICIAYYSPALYLDLIQLFTSKDKTFKLLSTHIVSNAHLGALAAHIQGIAGAGKTFQVMAIMTTLFYLVDLNTLWVTKQNNPLYTAALAAERYLPADGVLPTQQIIRVLATSHDDHTTPVDVQRSTKGHTWPRNGLVILTSGLAATYLDCNPNLGDFFSTCDIAIFDEAQQFGMEEEAILFTTLPETCMFTFIGDPEQPTGSATSHFAQLVIQKIACSRPGLRSTHITFRTENEYINNYLLFFDRNPSTDDSIKNSNLLFSVIIQPALRQNY
jgi:hypothetical protein